MKKFLQRLKQFLKIVLEIIGSFRVSVQEEKPAAPKIPGRLRKFIDTYLGKAVDWDGHFGAQCVDLVRQYWQEVDKIPQPEPTGTEGAIAFFNNHDNRPVQRRYLYRVEYRPGMIPPPGAVIVFSAVPTNRFGHIGICVGADEKCLDLFEQNGTANSRAKAEGRKQKGAFIGRWNYNRVLGWLVKR